MYLISRRFQLYHVVNSHFHHPSRHMTTCQSTRKDKQGKLHPIDNQKTLPYANRRYETTSSDYRLVKASMKMEWWKVKIRRATEQKARYKTNKLSGDVNTIISARNSLIHRGKSMWLIKKAKWVNLQGIKNGSWEKVGHKKKVRNTQNIWSRQPIPA